MSPLAIDLFCGLGGWSEGLLAEGWDVVGFDIERHHYGEAKYPAQLVIQDVLTIHGRQFKSADLIVASPPCQEYSYMAMPWSLAKQKRAEYLDGTRNVADLTALFDACFRIQREASEAAGHHIPLVVENVRGAQEWVGRSRWNFGSFHLWGDVPALMPLVRARAMKIPTGNGKRSEKSRSAALANYDQLRAEMGVKQSGISGVRANGKGDLWFQEGAAKSGSKSAARKSASALIAKIPLVLSQHIAHVYKPQEAA